MKRSSPSVPHPQAALSGQTLIIEGDRIPVEHRRIPLKDVQLDPGNPRIQHAVKQQSKNGSLTQDQLRTLILDRPGVSELFRSIRDNGGLFEPIYVRPDGRIIEGNCRAASYLKLHGIDTKDIRWQTIPAVFVPEISDRQVAILQGHYHVAGKNKWLAYEKAGHLHAMHTNLGMDAKAIGQALGMHERDVLRDLKAYEIMTEKVLPKMKGAKGPEKWSFVSEFYKRKGLADYRSNPANVDAFVKLVVDKKLKHGADVRKLEKIISHPKAVRELKTHGVERAMSVVGQVDPTANSIHFRKLKQTAKLLQHLPSNELQLLRDSEKPRAILTELFAAVKNVAKAAGLTLS